LSISTVLPVTLLAPHFAAAGGIATLGVDVKALVLQIITFVIVFLLLKKFAFSKIVATLETRRKTIDDSVRLGEELARQKTQIEAEIAKIMQTARLEADKIMTASHNEATDIIKKAEEDAAHKIETMLAEARNRIADETAGARKALEKQLLGFVGEATEIIIGEKLDERKDAKLIERALQETTR